MCSLLEVLNLVANFAVRLPAPPSVLDWLVLLLAFADYGRKLYRFLTRSRKKA